MKRTFLAIKIPVSKKATEIINDIKFVLKDEKIKWVESWNLHVTLFFLGDTEEELIGEISQSLSDKFKNTKSFILRYSGLGVFKNVYNPKTIWFGIEKSENLQKLKSDINHAMNLVGFNVEAREFRPHLTIARTKFLKDKNQLKELINKYCQLDIQDTEIKEIIFYESKLTAKGPIYKVLKSIPLN